MASDGVEYSCLQQVLFWTPGMTLAAILSLCIFCSRPAVAIPAWTQSSQQLSEGKPADSSAPSSQTTNDAPQGEPAAATPKQSPAVVKRKRQSKAKNPAPCSAAADTKTSSTSSSSDPVAVGSPAASSPAGATLPPCGPAKVVVRNGGTAEGTVRVTGGSATAKDSPQRASTNRLLGSTEEELKTLAGRPPDSSQQETVKQIQQYVAQSRAALAAGDLDLAHNLALKAHLLADELLKPKP
jgi:hypothetical protein